MIEYPLSEAQERRLLRLQADEVARDEGLTVGESAELRFLVELSGGLSKDEWEMERSSVEDIRRELSDLEITEK